METTQYYNKTIIYGDYVRNIIIPCESLKNDRNANGTKNTGENDKKLDNSNYRAKCSAVRKAYHNFTNIKELTFLTLTYALNKTNVKNCKKDLNKFFKNLRYYFKDLNQELKYFYTYEYQARGAVHFHILLNVFIPNDIVLKYWPYGLNKNVKVRKDTNETVVKYCSKYITKSFLQDNQNQYDLNIKSYQFSYSCVNPISKKRVFTDSIQNIINRVVGSSFFKFLKKQINDLKSIVVGVIYEFKHSDYQDFNAENYASLESLRFRDKLKRFKF